METKFNFKSAICTSREQSERLLALGLKKETADMIHSFKQTAHIGDWFILPIYHGDNRYCKEFIPAWSLGRLVEIIKGCDFKVFESEIWRRETKHFILRLLITTPDDLFENAIQVIETLVCKGYFNKEYLG